MLNGENNVKYTLRELAKLQAGVRAFYKVEYKRRAVKVKYVMPGVGSRTVQYQ